MQCDHPTVALVKIMPVAALTHHMMSLSRQLIPRRSIARMLLDSKPSPLVKRPNDTEAYRDPYFLLRVTEV